MRARFMPLSYAFTVVAMLFIAGCKEVSPPQEEARETPPPRETPRTNTLEQAAQLKEPFPPDSILKERPVTPSVEFENSWDWRVQALLAGYRATGKTNRQWDAHALAAFEAQATHVSDSSGANLQVLRDAASAAVEAGCEDPMIRYLHARYRFPQPAPEIVARDFIEIHDAMIRSEHHPMFKFYAGWRADEAIRGADWRIKRPNRKNQTTAHLVDLVRDPNAPTADVFEAARIWVTYDASRNWIDYASYYADRVLKARSSDTHHWFAYEGEVQLERAWKARGGGWAHSVTEEGWEGFRQHLAAARSALETAWDMEPQNARTAFLRMRVAQGDGDLPAIRRYFEEVMKLDPNHSDAVWLMSYSLEPRWFGSREEALKFARSCVDSEVWGGSVPLVLPALHESLSRFYHKEIDAREYWHREEVWQDVKAAYEKYFSLNPQWSGWRERFAKHAFYCGKYTEFLEQIEMLSESPDYSEFDGKEQFTEMVEQARQATGE